MDAFFTLAKRESDFLESVSKKTVLPVPKILLMMRHRQDGNGVSQDIVFNLTPKDFKDENTYITVMQTISWYLPRHYSFVGMDEQTFPDGFMAL